MEKHEISQEVLLRLREVSEEEQWGVILAYPKAVQYIQPTKEQLRYAIQQDPSIYRAYRNRDLGQELIAENYGTYEGDLIYIHTLSLVIAGCWAGSITDFEQKCSEQLGVKQAKKTLRKLRKVVRIHDQKMWDYINSN